MVRAAALFALTGGVVAAYVDQAGEHYPYQRRYQRYVVSPFVSVPEGLLTRNHVEIIEDPADWERLASSPLYDFVDEWKGQSVVLLGPRSHPISCGRHGFDVPGEGSMTLHLFEPTDDFPESAGGCAVAVPATRAGAFIVKPYWPEERISVTPRP